MKVVFLIDSLQTGGAEKSILEIAQKLHTIEPIVCVLYADKDDLRLLFEQAEIAIIDLNIPRGQLFWFITGKLKFEKICSELQPDLVHAHLFKSEFIARISKLPNKTKLVGSFVNDSYSRERYKSQSFIRNLKLEVIAWIDRLTIRKSQYITSITNAIAVSNTKKLNYPLHRVHVINRGRTVTAFDQNKLVYNPELPFEFITVGRLLERKGYFELIQAVKLLKSKTNKSFKLTIVGKGADEKSIMKCVSESQLDTEIVFLGTRSDVPLLLQKAHCFVLPSHYEGQGGALVEAMLSGLPIVCSDIDVFKEQVAADVSAKLFEVKSAEDLAKQLLWMINHYTEAKQLGNEARKTALEKFDIEKIAQQTEAFYLKVISS